MYSHNVTRGPARAGHRSLFKAMGYSSADLEKPLIGVVNSFNEIVPGHAHLNELAQAVKLGVAAAGGTPIEYPSIAICDGISMNHDGMRYPLASRELIADSIEAMTIAHKFDGLVLIGNCDKTVPGMLMAAARLNLPAIYVSGGPMLTGSCNGEKVDLVRGAFEAVGAYARGAITEAELEAIEDSSCPTCGSCAGLFTANTMNCLAEALGMALPGNGTIPAPYGLRKKLAKETGFRIVSLVKENLRPRDVLTLTAFKNAIALDMAIGGSTNTVLHLLAIAHEAKVPLELEEFDRISTLAPNLTKISPGGTHRMYDLYEAGGISAVLNQLAQGGLIETGAKTVTGLTIGENVSGVRVKDPAVIRPLDNPYGKEGGIAILRGNLAPGGAVVKQSAVAPEMLRHEGPARVFDSEEESIRATSSSSATKGLLADPACARCSAPRRPFREWAWTRTWH